jgi:hypothetical protein
VLWFKKRRKSKRERYYICTTCYFINNAPLFRGKKKKEEKKQAITTLTILPNRISDYGTNPSAIVVVSFRSPDKAKQRASKKVDKKIDRIIVRGSMPYYPDYWAKSSQPLPPPHPPAY